MNIRSRTLVAVAVAWCLASASNLHGDDLFLDVINTDQIEIAEVSFRVRTSSTARRVVIVFLDGLRDDVAFAQPGLAELGRRGFIRTVVADFPSFTYPAVATIATGVPPAYSGVRLNWGGADPPLDSLSKRAAAEGFEVRIAEAEFAPFRRLLFPGSDARRMSVEEAVTSTAAKTLTWIYFGDIDRAGHRDGAVDPTYRAAARDGDALVARVLDRVDLDRDTVFVISDHGHLDGGGHGGTEPDALRGVWIGAGVGVATVGRRPAGRLRDVAGTVAAVMGIEQPRHSFGRARTDVLTFDRAPTFPPMRDRSVEDRAYESASRVRAIAIGLVALLLALVFARRMKLVVRDAMPTAIHSVVFATLYIIAGYGWTWTVPRGYPGFLVETVLFSAVGIVAALWRANGHRRAEEALACGLLHGVPYLALAAAAGLDPRWMPGPFVSWGVVLVATLQFYICLALGARALWFVLPFKRASSSSASS